MRTPEYLASQVSEGIASKKDALIQEVVNRYYGEHAPWAKWLLTQPYSSLQCIEYPDMTVYYIEGDPVLEIYPVEMVCTDEPGVVSFDFKYRSLI